MAFWYEWLVSAGVTADHASMATAVASLMCLGIILTVIGRLFK